MDDTETSNKSCSYEDSERDEFELVEFEKPETAKLDQEEHVSTKISWIRLSLARCVFVAGGFVGYL